MFQRGSLQRQCPGGGTTPVHLGSLESSEEEEENLEIVNILKKPIRISKWTKQSKRAQEALEAQATKKTQVAQEVRLQFEVEEILQALREAVQLKNGME